jgi:hypothetical protein
MDSKRKFYGLLVLIVFSLPLHAVNLPLQNLSSDDMNKVVEDMSANFLHTSVSGASTLGHLYGFEVGVVGGQTSTPHLNTVVQEADPTVSVNKLPNAELLGVLTVPLGFTGEVGFVPSVGSSDFKYNTLSLAAKWTATEVVLSDLPFSLAGKVAYTSSTVTFDQTVQTVPINYNYTNSETAFTVLASKNFAIVEPYVGLGYATATGNLSATGSSSVFQSGVSGNAKVSSAIWMAGAEVKLLVVKLGAEYTSLFNTSRLSGKLSFYF